ncbi:MAG: hypothetical protein ACOYOT_00730 [Bacteroidales bacterium]
MKRIAFILMITIVGLTNCSPNYEKIFAENNDKFDKNRVILNNIVQTIEQNYLIKWDGKSEFILSIDSLDSKTKNSLENLGVGSIEFSRNPNLNCQKSYWITFNISNGWNISTLRVVQLVYAPCDSKGEIKDRHKRSNYDKLIDYWGQGDGWFVYSDSDFI